MNISMAHIGYIVKHRITKKKGIIVGKVISNDTIFVDYGFNKKAKVDSCTVNYVGENNLENRRHSYFAKIKHISMGRNDHRVIQFDWEEDEIDKEEIEICKLPETYYFDHNDNWKSKGYKVGDRVAVEFLFSDKFEFALYLCDVESFEKYEERKRNREELQIKFGKKEADENEEEFHELIDDVEEAFGDHLPQPSELNKMYYTDAFKAFYTYLDGNIVDDTQSLESAFGVGHHRIKDIVDEWESVSTDRRLYFCSTYLQKQTWFKPKEDNEENKNV